MNKELTDPEQKVHPWYRISRFMARNYMGLFFTYYASLVAETFLIWGCMIGFGLAIDFGRKKFVPELNEPIEKLWERFNRARNNLIRISALNFLKRPIASLFWATWIYSVGIIVLHNFYGSEVMNGYFLQFREFTEFMSHISRRQENLLYELERVGSQNLMPLTDHVYAVSHAGMMGVMVLVFCFGGINTLGKGLWHLGAIQNRTEEWKQYRKSVLGLQIISIFSVVFFEITANNKCISEFNEAIKCETLFGSFIDTLVYFIIIFIGQIFIYHMLLISMMLTDRGLNSLTLNGKTEKHKK